MMVSCCTQLKYKNVMLHKICIALHSSVNRANPLLSRITHFYIYVNTRWQADEITVQLKRYKFFALKHDPGYVPWLVDPWP